MIGLPVRSHHQWTKELPRQPHRPMRNQGRSQQHLNCSIKSVTNSWGILYPFTKMWFTEIQCNMQVHQEKMVCSAFPLIVIKIQYCKQIVTQEMRVAIRNDFDSLIQGLPVKTKWHVSLNLSLYPAIITHRDKNLCQISHMLMNLDSMRDSYCITLGYRIYQVGANLPHFAPHISEVQGARGGHFRSRHHGRANLS